MKMTDEQMQEQAPGEYTDWEKRVWRRGYDDARLAADQQKGGGEVVAQLYVSDSNVQLCPIAPGKLSDSEIRRRHGNGTHDLIVRAGPKFDDERLASMIEHGMGGVDWSPTPQPSIPAPAQPGVDEAMARRYLAAQKAHVSKVDAAFGRQVAGALHSDDVVAACMAGLAAAFNVPAQQDGKASGGEES